MEYLIVNMLLLILKSKRNFYKTFLIATYPNYLIQINKAEKSRFSPFCSEGNNCALFQTGINENDLYNCRNLGIIGKIVWQKQSWLAQHTQFTT